MSVKKQSTGHQPRPKAQTEAKPGLAIGLRRIQTASNLGFRVRDFGKPRNKPGIVLPPSPGFTLIELVISASLMAIILTSAFLCLNAAFSSQRLLEPRLEAIQNARVALGLMAADLRNACTLSKNIDFLGMHRTLGDMDADNLDFGTHNYTPRRPNEADFCQESFFLGKDTESGEMLLWRRRNPRLGLDPLSGGTREEIARGVRGLRFEYYDGFEWYDTWGDVEGRGKVQSSRRERFNLDGLPEAVRITLWVAPSPRRKKSDSEREPKPEPPLQFQTVARLNLAAKELRSSTQGSSQESDQSTPQPGNENRPQ